MMRSNMNFVHLGTSVPRLILGVALTVALQACNDSRSPPMDHSFQVNEVPFTGYADIEKCWKSQESESQSESSFNFKGAIAFYPITDRSAPSGSSERAYYPVLFSSACYLRDAELSGGSDPAYLVQAGPISLSSEAEALDALQEYVAQTKEVEQSNPIIDRIGVTPEFPDSIYAIEGRIIDVSRSPGRENARSERMMRFRVDVRQAQALPKDMYGAFLFYPEDRPLYIRQYLSDDFNYNDQGYRIPFPRL